MQEAAEKVNGWRTLEGLRRRHYYVKGVSLCGRTGDRVHEQGVRCAAVVACQQCSAKCYERDENGERKFEAELGWVREVGG
jgi:hypothetical protein